MKKLKDTKTNEARAKLTFGRSNVVDTNHAKFRANKLKVIKIFNKNSPKLTKRFVVNEYGDHDGKATMRYSIGKIVEPNDYDEDIENVCSRGIHYFKTLEAAYYYGTMQQNYTGHWIEWHDNGQKSEEGAYVNGHLSGHWIFWHDNGQKAEEGAYINGHISGHWIFWHDNGQKSEEGDYVNGHLSGHWIKWRYNGQKVEEGDYAEGERSGDWTYWGDNGKMCSNILKILKKEID